MFEVVTVLLSPMVATLMFDEVNCSIKRSTIDKYTCQSCLRYYLSFDDNLLKLMEAWRIGQLGGDAYRCVHDTHLPFPLLLFSLLSIFCNLPAAISNLHSMCWWQSRILCEEASRRIWIRVAYHPVDQYFHLFESSLGDVTY